MEELELKTYLLSERPDVYYHCKRTAYWAHKIAVALDFPVETAEEIRHAAEVHDIGKVCIPRNILDKPGKLTSIEFAVMDSHVSNGILDCFRFRSDFNRFIAEHHHSHHSMVTKECAIVSVADVFDALTSKRSYREPASEKEAIMIMRMNPRNRNLDQRIISVLANIISSPKFIYQEIESLY